MKTPPDSLDARTSTAVRKLLGGAAGGRFRGIGPQPERAPAPKKKDAGQPARFATIVVAAADSTNAGQAGADFVCSGSADDVTLNLAIAALGSAGGMLKLLEGTYQLAAPISPATTCPLWIDGCGARNTVLDGSDTDATIDRGTFDEWLRVTSLGFLDAEAAITWQNASLGVDVADCIFDSCLQAIKSVYGGGSDLDYYISLARNVFNGCGGTGVNGVVELQQRTSHLLVAGNDFDNTDNATTAEVYVTSADTGNRGQFARITENAAQRKGILLAYHNAFTVSDNVVNGDVTIDHVTDGALVGNVCWGTYAATNTGGTIAKAGNVGIV